MSQRSEILSMLKNSLNHEISCSDLAFKGLYHHASQRIGEMRGEHDIRYIPSDTSDPMDAKYKLFEPEIKENQVIMDLGSLE